MSENCFGIAHDGDAHAGDLEARQRVVGGRGLVVRSDGEI